MIDYIYKLFTKTDLNIDVRCVKWKVLRSLLGWTVAFMAEQVWGASIYVKAYKIHQSHIFKKLFFFPQVLSSGTRLQRRTIRNVLVSMSFTIQSKQTLPYISIQMIIFLCLFEEKGPVPLKVGLIVAEVGWCPCNVQSLYPLQCLCMSVRAYEVARSLACMYTSAELYWQTAKYKRHWKFLNLLRTQQDEILNTGRTFKKLKPFYSAKQLTVYWKKTAYHMHI